MPSPNLTPLTHLLRHRIPSRSYGSHAPAPLHEPSGYAFGHKPPQKGYKRKRAAWEWLFNYGYVGAMTFLAITVFYLPDNR